MNKYKHKNNIDKFGIDHAIKYNQVIIKHLELYKDKHNLYNKDYNQYKLITNEYQDIQVELFEYYIDNSEFSSVMRLASLDTEKTINMIVKQAELYSDAMMLLLRNKARFSILYDEYDQALTYYVSCDNDTAENEYVNSFAFKECYGLQIIDHSNLSLKKRIENIEHIKQNRNSENPNDILFGNINGEFNQVA